MLLTRKIRKPELPSRLITRDKANQYLLNFEKYRITLLSAPAGYGKTTTLNSFLNSIPTRSIWYSLDTTDNTPQIFWHYFIHALKSLDPMIGKKSLILLKSDSQGDQHEAINYLIEELSKFTHRYLNDESVAIIVDDFQIITNSLLIEQFNYFLDFLPRKLHIVISSRSQPAILISKRLAMGEVLVVPKDALLFNSDEIRKFYCVMKDIELSNKSLRLALNISGGWVGALQILTVSDQIEEERSDNNLVCDGEYLSLLHEYLETEVIQAISQRNISIYSCFSTLLQVPEELIFRIIPEDGSEWIRQGKQLNLLTEFFDNGTRYYLLNEVVKNYFKNKSNSSPNKYNEVIITYFLEREDFFQLFEIGVNQEDWALAAKGAMHSLKSLIKRGDYHLGRRYLDRFPSPIIDNFPAFKLFIIWMDLYASGHYFAEKKTSDVLNFISNLENKDAQTRLRHGIFNDEHYQLIKKFSDLTKFQLELLKNGSVDDENIVISVSNSAVEGGDFSQWSWNGLGVNAFMKGNMTLAEKNLQKAIFKSQDHQDGYCLLSTLAVLGPCLLFSGKPSEALSLCESVHHWCVEHGYDVSGQYSIIHRVRLLVYRETNNLKEAEIHFNLLRDCPRYIDPLNRTYHLWSEVLYHLGRNNANSRTALNKLETHFNQHYLQWNLGIPSPSLMNNILDVLDGDHTGIAKWAKKFKSYWSKNKSTSQQYTFELLVYCRVLLASGGNPEAPLNFMIETAIDKGNLYIEIKATLLLACYRIQRLRKSEYVKLILECIIKAQRSNLCRTVLDEKDFIVDALDERNINYLSQQYAINSGQIWTELVSNESNDTPQIHGHNLTNREQQVLEYLLDGLSNFNISKALGISKSTVKSHVANIYGKYGVNNRIKLMKIATSQKVSESMDTCY